MSFLVNADSTKAASKKALTAGGFGRAALTQYISVNAHSVVRNNAQDAAVFETSVTGKAGEAASIGETIAEVACRCFTCDSITLSSRA